MILLLPELSKTIERARQLPIPEERKPVLQELVDYIQEKINDRKKVHLNFICTHNSRRSQFAQIWTQTAADYFGIPVQCYSGGVEVTEFNPRAVASIERSGFKVVTQGISNPAYSVYYAENGQPITAFSKLYDDPANPTTDFAAVMTCSHADENCPFIPGTEKRIALLYDDPKAFDDTPQETAKYDERSMQIASELFYVFNLIT
ncbi:MAG: protein-tyrosine-phosphatase [Cyclobacteriaceae bacterium]|nr:protein-tyrosine-phosphatase [Cyclobacteriaceae bacterium]